MAKHLTFRGQSFNMAAFADANGEKVAVGNSGRNARGDVLNNKGEVIATAQQVNAAYHKKNPKAVAKVSITQDPEERLASQAPKQAVKPAPAPAATVEPTPDPSTVVVSKRMYTDENGEERTEITYADGSVEVV